MIEFVGGLSVGLLLVAVAGFGWLWHRQSVERKALREEVDGLAEAVREVDGRVREGQVLVAEWFRHRRTNDPSLMDPSPLFSLAERLPRVVRSAPEAHEADAPEGPKMVTRRAPTDEEEWALYHRSQGFDGLEDGEREAAEALARGYDDTAELNSEGAK